MNKEKTTGPKCAHCGTEQVAEDDWIKNLHALKDQPGDVVCVYTADLRKLLSEHERLTCDSNVAEVAAQREELKSLRTARDLARNERDKAQETLRRYARILGPRAGEGEAYLATLERLLHNAAVTGNVLTDSLAGNRHLRGLIVTYCEARDAAQVAKKYRKDKFLLVSELSPGTPDAMARYDAARRAARKAKAAERAAMRALVAVALEQEQPGEVKAMDWNDRYVRNHPSTWPSPPATGEAGPLVPNETK